MKRLVWVLFLVCAPAFADSFFVETSNSQDVNGSDRGAVEELIRVAVAENGKHFTVSNKEKANWILSANILKLGDSYVLTLQKRNKQDQVVFAEKMKAKTMADMDTVASRLTRAVVEQRRVSDTADVTNITQEEETMNTRRYQATRQWIIGMGPGWTTNLHSKGGGFTFTLGFLWGLDPDFGLNLTWTMNSGPSEDQSSYTDFSLGGEYYFSRTKNSPFVGARLGYGGARTDDNCNVLGINCSKDTASGWATNLQAGYKFFRTSTVNAAIAAYYSVLFAKTSAGTPSLAGVNLLVYY